MQKSKRRFLVGAVVTAGAAILGWLIRRGSWRERKPFPITARPPKWPNEPRAASPGLLTGDEKRELCELFEELREHWGVAAVDEREFLEFIDLKTGRDPSYLVEYRNALAFFRSHRTEGALIDGLRASDSSDSNKVYAQRFVVRELADYLIIRAGPGGYGIANAPGFMGGPQGYRSSSEAG